MASITSATQVLTTSGVPFTGVLRIFPNGYSPTFGAVLHYEYNDGYLVDNTGNNSFADDNYCVQWLHFATIGNSANGVPQACEYVVDIAGPSELADLQTEMISYDSYVSALTTCQADLMAMEAYAQSLEAQLQSCQDAAASNVAALQTALDDCEDQLTAQDVVVGDLQQQLETTEDALVMCQASLDQCLQDLETMTTEDEIAAQEQAIRDQMLALRSAEAGITTIRLPSCAPDTPKTTAQSNELRDRMSGYTASGYKTINGSNMSTAGASDPAEDHRLMQRMAGYAAVPSQSVKHTNASESTLRAAATAARVRQEKQALLGKMSELAKYSPAAPCDDKRLPVNIVNPPAVIPEGTPTPEVIGNIRSRIEEFKANCGN